MTSTNRLGMPLFLNCDIYLFGAWPHGENEEPVSDLVAFGVKGAPVPSPMVAWRSDLERVVLRC